jgi:NADPH-dependent 2,4-dienoyl-CoA reductase/sulfur reductase-like enzyme
VGREREYELTRALKSRKVLVIGGGPAGMESALVASQRGHSVTLYEKKNQLGGQLLLATKPPHKEELQNIMNYYSAQLRKNAVRIELNQTAGEQTITNEAPDAVILAAGAMPSVPHISGVNSSKVITAWDVLAGLKTPNEKTVVVGGGEVGCETAEYIASSGAEVTITEMLDYMGGDIELLTRRLLLERLHNLGVEFITDAKVVDIVEDGIYFTGQRRGRQYVEASTVVLATGSKPNNNLVNAITHMGIEVHVIGDCVEPRGILEAIREGSEVGRVV